MRDSVQLHQKVRGAEQTKAKSAIRVGGCLVAFGTKTKQNFVQYTFN